MGILYLDEAGNSGLWDDDQPKLIYGGPYIPRDSWKAMYDGLQSLQQKYQTLILSRYITQIRPTSNISKVLENVTFLHDFEFHAKEIINQNQLWYTLDDEEKFGVLKEIVDLMIQNNVILYAGILDKKSNRPAKKPKRVNKNSMTEYDKLFKTFFAFVESNLKEHEEYTVIADDGNLKEKKVMRDNLLDASLQKCTKELIIGDFKYYPLLQVADIGVWILQSYHKLDSSRSDKYAEKVRALYDHLIKSSICKEIQC